MGLESGPVGPSVSVATAPSIGPGISVAATIGPSMQAPDIGRSFSGFAEPSPNSLPGPQRSFTGSSLHIDGFTQLTGDLGGVVQPDVVRSSPQEIMGLPHLNPSQDAISELVSGRVTSSLPGPDNIEQSLKNVIGDTNPYHTVFDREDLGNPGKAPSRESINALVQTLREESLAKSPARLPEIKDLQEPASQVAMLQEETKVVVTEIVSSLQSREVNVPQIVETVQAARDNPSEIIQPTPDLTTSNLGVGVRQKLDGLREAYVAKGDTSKQADAKVLNLVRAELSTAQNETKVTSAKANGVEEDTEEQKQDKEAKEKQANAVNIDTTQIKKGEEDEQPVDVLPTGLGKDEEANGARLDEIVDIAIDEAQVASKEGREISGDNIASRYASRADKPTLISRVLIVGPDKSSRNVGDEFRGRRFGSVSDVIQHGSSAIAAHTAIEPVRGSTTVSEKNIQEVLGSANTLDTE